MELQARAAELNALRGPMSTRGTTSAIQVRNRITGEVQTRLAVEGRTMPAEWEGMLRPGEVFVEGSGHAEQTIVKSLGDDWEIVQGGASRNVCRDGGCSAALEAEGVTLEGHTFRGMADKTRFRMFY
jgi:hypothetical protein